jgi:hypothetical protein
MAEAPNRSYAAMNRAWGGLQSGRLLGRQVGKGTTQSRSRTWTEQRDEDMNSRAISRALK